jgi:hypothetical protein
MGWETRGNREYYYEKEWIDGKCVSKYRGTGELAVLIGQLERGRRLERRRDRAVEARKRVSAGAVDNEIDQLSKLNKSLVDALFLINGYHQHKRQWRKKR